MSAQRHTRAALVAGWMLAACSATHGRQDQPALRGGPRAGEDGALDDTAAAGDPARDSDDAPGEGMSGNGGRSDGSTSSETGSGGGAASSPSGIEGVEQELQVWLGVVRTDGQSVCSEMDEPAEPHDERVLLLLETDTQGVLAAASITLGEGPAPAPAEDPDDFYPPGAPFFMLCPLVLPLSGFEYPTHQLRLHAARLELTLYPSDAYAQWCDLQQSYPASADAKARFGQDYLCRPTEGMELSELYAQPDFSPDQLCLARSLRACTCDAERCKPEPQYPIVFDLQVEGDEMQGRVIPYEAPASEIRLHRER